MKRSQYKDYLYKHLALFKRPALWLSKKIQHLAFSDLWQVRFTVFKEGRLKAILNLGHDGPLGQEARLVLGKTGSRWQYQTLSQKADLKDKRVSQFLWLSHAESVHPAIRKWQVWILMMPGPPMTGSQERNWLSCLDMTDSILSVTSQFTVTQGNCKHLCAHVQSDQ